MEGFVTSRDGTRIGYQQVGQGTPIVLLHGSMSSSQHHMEQARLLADAFTVIVPDRRGRGLSEPYGKDDGLQQEVEDLEAVLTATGARRVFGLSSGGVITLEAALRLPMVERIVVYEPPLFTDPAVSQALLDRLDHDLDRDNIAGALVTGMKGAQMGPPIFNLFPNWLLERMVGRFVAQEAKQGTGSYPSMGALAPLLHYDFKAIAQASGNLQRFGSIRAVQVLMGGGKSPTFLKSAVQTLAKFMPDCSTTTFPGLGHEASWNTDKGGQPEPVARALRLIFE